MKVHKIFGLIMLSCSGLVSLSQDYHFSGFIPNLVFANPAYAAIPASPEIALTYRNQWPGIPATFVTYGASFVFPVESMNSGLGVNVLNDVQGSGVITRTYAGLLYGYRIEIGSEWQIGGGIRASYVFKKFDADELVFRSDILNDLGYGYSSVVLENYSKSYPDFGIGLVIMNGSGFSSGLSVSHITRPHESVSSPENDRLPLRYAGFIKGRLGLSGSYSKLGVVFEPALYFTKQGIYQELIWGMQTVISSAFMIGGWFRQNLKFNYDALIFSVGILKEKYNFLYSYDVNVKKVKFLSTKMAAHEVTFLYRFEYKGKKVRAVPCPAYY